MRSLQTTPPRMVEENGSVHFGTFRTPFKDVNILDAPLYSWPVPRFWKNFRLKEWQHFGIITPAYYFGLVIFDAKLTGVSFFYAYDRKQNTRTESMKQSGKALSVAPQVYNGVCRFEVPGYAMRIENHLDEGFHRIVLDIKSAGEFPGVQGEMVVYEDLNQLEPLVQVSPITGRRPFYTHKAALPAAGNIRLGAEDIRLDPEKCIALLDEQKTYYPYVSFWKWATAAGYGKDGKLMAFNLCQNMIADDEDANENCFWIDGKIYCLKAARFEYGDVMKPWKIWTTDGKLDLSFVPMGQRHQKINTAGIIRSNFHQPFGLYNGRFTDDSGIIHPISDFFGLAEDHMTRY